MKNSWTAGHIRRVSVIVAALLLTSIVAISLWAAKARSGPISAADSVVRKSPAHAHPAAIQVPPSGNSHGSVQVVRFALYDAGIIPKQARARKGLVAVTLEDHSGSSAGLIVERQNNGHTPERAGQVRHYDGSRRGRTELRLEPGIYAVFDGDNPERRAELTVEP